MKYLICYWTKTGTTAKCAEKLKKILEKSGGRVTLALLPGSLKGNGKAIPFAPELFREHDCAIIGAPVRMGSLPAEVKKFFAEYGEKLLPLTTAYFICNAFPAKTEEVLVKNIPGGLLQSSVCAASFGGEVDLDKQKGFDRFMAKMMGNVMKQYHAQMPEVQEESITAFAETLLRCQGPEGADG